MISATQIEGVHVWQADLDAPLELQCAEGLLSPDESARASRFRFDTDRRRFVAGRALLRIILGRYLDQSPALLAFQYNAFGKPALACAHDQVRLEFNISHADRLFVCAVAHNRKVGIDVASVRQHESFWEVADEYFTANERAAVAAQPLHRQAEAFARCWSRKEAYIKADGRGLSLPLQSFDLAATLSGPRTVLDVKTSGDDFTHWSVIDLPLDPSYAATVVVQSVCERVVCWDFALSERSRCQSPPE